MVIPPKNKGESKRLGLLASLLDYFNELFDFLFAV